MKRLEFIKKQYTNSIKNLSSEDFIWLINRANDADRFEKALIDLHVEGLSIEEILSEADKWSNEQSKNGRTTEIKFIQGTCAKCNGTIDSEREVGDKPTARIYCKECLSNN